MLTRLLQAIALTSAIYLTMLIHQSPTQPAFLLSSQHSAVKADRITHLLAEMIDLLRLQRRATRHSAASMD